MQNTYIKKIKIENRELIDDCLAFYSKDGFFDNFFEQEITERKIIEAITCLQLAMPDHPLRNDSLDRELVRDVMLYLYEGCTQPQMLEYSNLPPALVAVGIFSYVDDIEVDEVISIDEIKAGKLISDMSEHELNEMHGQQSFNF